MKPDYVTKNYWHKPDKKRQDIVQQLDEHVQDDMVYV